MVSSECAPLAKTGGLADVVGALPTALRDYGDQAAVVIPRYGGIDLTSARRVYDGLSVWLGPVRHDVTVYQAPAEFPLYLIDCPPLFDRPGYYGSSGVDYPDNHIRFAVFARAALGVARYLFRPDILHCHDWQAGLVPVYLRSTLAGDPTFLGVRTLFVQQLVQRTSVVHLALQRLVPIDLCLQAGELGRDLCRPLRIVPEPGIGRLTFELTELRALAVDVKGTPSRQRHARRSSRGVPCDRSSAEA